MEGDIVGDEEQDNDTDGLVDIWREMSDENITALDKTLQPVQLIHKLAFTIKNSTMIVLPEWLSILEQHTEASEAAKEKPLSIQIMPCDVATCWNSMFDMLEFVLLYRDPLDDLTGIQEMKLRAYELSEGEWRISEQLCGVLKDGKKSGLRQCMT
ncbi:hypothetical protein V8E53_011699 [Lactarius tabidus]